MIKKSFIAILIILIALFLTVSSVNAAENNVTYDLNIEYSSIDNGCIGNSINATFNDLNEFIENSQDSEINLEKDYNYYNDTDYNFKNGIEIVGPLTIDGGGHVINAMDSARIFNIKSENVTLKNIHFKNGFSEANGGAINTAYGLSLINSTFTNNVAENGGAIFAKSDVSVENSVFKSNVLQNFSGNEIVCVGGAIYADGNVVVKNSEFADNCAYYGGAIHTEGENVSLIDSLFNNNTSKLYAGGVVHTSGNVNVLNSVFIKNHAPSYGGAIFTYGNELGKVNVKNSTFLENNGGHSGGAICSSTGVNISDSLFEKNYAEDFGSVLSTWGDIFLYNSKVINNSAEGVICVIDTIYSNTTVIGCEFIENHVAGGVLENEGGTLVINSTFVNNTGYASAVRDYCSMRLINSTFTNNSGRSAPVQCYGSLNIVNCSLNKNRGEYVGAIRGFKDVTVENSNISDNTAEKIAGAIYASSIMIVNSTLSNNKGGYDNNLYGTLNIISSKIIDSGIDVADKYGDGAKIKVKVVKTKRNSKINVDKTKKFNTKTKTKKYVVTLKSGNNAIKKAKIQLIISGKKYKKTFSSKTNSQGKAIFKITKLTKLGTYSATMKFKGDKNYKSTTKKLKITVNKKKSIFKVTSKDVINNDEDSQKLKIVVTKGKYVDASDAYKSLNNFRTQKKVWYWNDDDVTKSYFNTNESNTLKPLERDETLEEVAKVRAREISDSFSHDLLDEISCFRIYPDYGCGENIACGMLTGSEAINLWKETDDGFSGQGHRRNMLDMNFDCVGIAGFEIDGSVYWVQCFGNKNI
ncbi:CAP domain-containing protein [Methanobrevibacter sp.]|uniref:CAP domain-containing protein n=1 Tax=Methanobrevibacter sp. TaxID=66852 RepID=UPI003865CA5C